MQSGRAPLANMSRLILCGALACVPVLGLGTPATAAPQHGVHPYIVGGDPVDPAPSWAAALGSAEDDMWCSGELVAPQWVLTAGHCEDAEVIRLGSAGTTDGGTVVHTTESVANPDYDFRLYKIDQQVGNAPVPLADDSPGAGSTATLYGYGQTCPQDGCGPMSSELLSADVPVTDDSDCGGIDGDGELCMDTEEDRSDCYGDSGGPAVVDGKLVGVDSRGADGSDADTCGATNSIYGDVSAVRSWITDTTGATR